MIKNRIRICSCSYLRMRGSLCKPLALSFQRRRAGAFRRDL